MIRRTFAKLAVSAVMNPGRLRPNPAGRTFQPTGNMQECADKGELVISRWPEASDFDVPHRVKEDDRLPAVARLKTRTPIDV